MADKRARTVNVGRKAGSLRRPPAARGSLPVPGAHTPFYGTDVDFVDGTIVCRTLELKKALHEFFQYEASGCHSATVVHSLGASVGLKTAKRKPGTARMLKRDGKSAASDPSTQDGGDIVVDVRC